MPLGYKPSQETRNKMRLAKLLNPPKNLFKKGHKPVGETNKGKKLPPHTQEWKEEARKRMLGNTRGFKKGNTGEKSHNWKGGLTPINKRIRNSKEYSIWRESVFKRDNYTCIWCKQKGARLNADHIKPFSLFPELRFAIDNGRTLCEPCHKTTDTWGYKIINYKK